MEQIFRVDWGWVRLGTERIRYGEREVKSVIYTYIQLYVIYAIPYGAVEVVNGCEHALLLQRLTSFQNSHWATHKHL